MTHLNVKKLSLLLLVALVGGCGTVQISQNAAELTVHTQVSTLLADCTRLGPLYTDTKGNPLNFDEVAEAAFRMQAIQKYGDRVDNLALINRRALPAGRIILQGMAYGCYK